MGRFAKVALAVSVALLLMGAALALWPRATSQTPEEAITATLRSAEAAARRGNVPDVLEAFSVDFRAGEWNRERLRLWLLRARNRSRGVDYDVRVNAPRFLPTRPDRPDERIVLTRFSVFDDGNGETYWGTEPLTLVMRRESRRKWLVLSEPHWRIVSIANLPPLPGLGD